MKKIRILLLSAILIAGITTYVLISDDKDYISYKDFHEELEKGNISSVQISDSTVEFSKKNDLEKYYTYNPEYDNFKSDLLLAGVVVQENNTEDTFNFIFNLIFYGIFFGIIGFIFFQYTKITSSSFKIIRNTNVKFDNIAGMDDLKKEMLAIVDVVKNQKEYSQKGIRQIKGIILEGPPGNGKTLFAKALASETNLKFVATKGADFQSAMMSMGARKIKSLFKKARKHKPCIIFIDEFDGIGERRNYAGTGVDKENNRIITAMLNEMDGFDSQDGILVIAATNSYNSLDPALIRPGRFDLKFNISNPDFNTRIKLIDLYTKKKKLSKEIKKEKLAETFENLSCAAIETILNEAMMISIMNKQSDITEENIIVAAKKTNCNINLKKLR